MKHLVLDVDGVILNWLGRFVEYMDVDHGLPPAHPPGELKDYSMQTLYPDLTSSEIFAHIVQMSRCEHHFSTIPFNNGVLEVIARMREVHPGLSISCVTSAGVGEEIARFRATNLAELAPDALVVLPLNADKSIALSRFPAGSLFVDDLVKNLEAADRAGLTPVLFATSYNEDAGWSGLCVRDWQELETLAMETLDRGVRPEDPVYAARIM